MSDQPLRRFYRGEAPADLRVDFRADAGAVRFEIRSQGRALVVHLDNAAVDELIETLLNRTRP